MSSKEKPKVKIKKVFDEIDDEKQKNTALIKKHRLNEHSTIEEREREKEFKFYCIYCDFGTFSKQTYEIHNNTDKHKKYVIRLKK